VTSLLLLISATIMLAGKREEQDGERQTLLLRGWQRTERLPCPNPEAGKFYELEGESEVIEAYAQGTAGALAAKLPLPSPVLHCREISRPHFIEEIL